MGGRPRQSMAAELAYTIRSSHWMMMQDAHCSTMARKVISLTGATAASSGTRGSCDVAVISDVIGRSRARLEPRPRGAPGRRVRRSSYVGEAPLTVGCPVQRLHMQSPVFLRGGLEPSAGERR